MRANEFITERKGHLRKSHERAMHRTHAYNDGYDAGNNYNFYRVGMAAAMADGTNKKLDIDDRTWYHNNNLAVPYTEQEHKMMHQAFGNVSTDVEEIVRDHSSKESKMTNNVSPVSGKRPNKYGV
jgi:hypothetical protein